MKIQYASDLHLEFLQNRRYLKSNPLEAEGDVLILAGDIAYLKDRHMEKFWFFKWVADHYRQTLIVPGNHEFYGGVEMSECIDNFEYKIFENVAYLNNRSAVIDGVEFFMSTLWSEIPECHKEWVQERMNDFYNSRYLGKRLSVDDYNRLHRNALAWLDSSIEASSAEMKVVVTHHVPTLRMCPNERLGDLLNSAYATELIEFIEPKPVDFWICGHTHSNHYPERIGRATILNNMLGYVEHESVYRSFRHDASFDL